MSLSLAVLVSGSGSNLQSIIDKIEAGARCAIKLVFSNKPDAYGLERAKKHGVMAKAASHKDFPSREALEAPHDPADPGREAEVVALAGFMRILRPAFTLTPFPSACSISIPRCCPASLAPCEQGDCRAVQGQALELHRAFVDELMDHGPIIVQAAVPTLQRARNGAHPGHGTRHPRLQ